MDEKKTINVGPIPQGWEKEIKVKLLRYTEEPELTIATAGHMCYAGVDVAELQKKMSIYEIRLLQMSWLQSFILIMNWMMLLLVI